MRRLVPLTLPSWSLPLVVFALIAPSVAAFALTGPQLGLAVGALTAATVVFLAGAARYDVAIEVAASSDDRFRILVITERALDDPAALEEIGRRLEAGRALPGLGGEAEVLVLVPATQSRLARWASDLKEARERAAGVLAVSMAALARAGIEAAGRIGDGDPEQAAEDELAVFAANEVAVVDVEGEHSAALEEIRRRLDRPVRRLELSAPEPRDPR